MKKNALFAMFLAAAMLLSMMAGCGSAKPAEASASVPAEASAADAPQEEAAPETETPAAEAPAPAEAEASAETVEEPEGEPVYDNYYMANPDLTPFPANDGTVISVWTTMPLSFVGLDSSGDVLAWQMLAEATGYDFDFTDANPETAATNFMLMAAANDFTDIIFSAVNYYTGGGGAAIEDGMIIDFAEYISEYIPNLQALMDADPSLARDVSTDDGYIPGVFSVLDHANYDDTGYAIRQDLLDKLGLEVPKTYDQVHDVLTALVNDGNGGLAIGPSGVSIQNNLVDGFGVYGEYTSVMGANPPLYVEGDQVKYGHMEQGFRDYIQTMADWYAEGLIYRDFISQGPTMSTDTNLIFNGDVSMFYSEAAQLPVTEESGASLIDGFDITPVPVILREEGSKAYYTTYPSHTENSWSVAANSAVIPQVLELFNFMYSDEGSLICNYGQEGVSYTVNDDGSYSYTDAVLNHEMGMRMGMMVYVMMGGPYKADVMRMINAYPPLAYEASVECWSPETTDITSIPGGVSLTTEESAEAANLLSDILTYAGTEITKYIMGDNSMDDYDTFTSTMEELGINRVVEIYQAAYDRYLSK